MTGPSRQNEYKSVYEPGVDYELSGIWALGYFVVCISFSMLDQKKINK